MEVSETKGEFDYEAKVSRIDAEDLLLHFKREDIIFNPKISEKEVSYDLEGADEDHRLNDLSSTRSIILPFDVDTSKWAEVKQYFLRNAEEQGILELSLSDGERYRSGAFGSIGFYVPHFEIKFTASRRYEEVGTKALSKVRDILKQFYANNFKDTEVNP